MKRIFTHIFQVFILSLFLSSNYSLYGQTPDSLITSDINFETSSHVVGTIIFHWYGPYAGQVSGPWIPTEGRKNWTGDAEFFKRMVKQAMAANIDVFYVHLIPQMEQERINLFKALFELRREGWDVPKVCPFFDPRITYTLYGHNGDAATEEGKDEIVGHYIRFYNQYFSQNSDAYADDYIYTQDNIPVLDVYRVEININNFDQLTREDVANRLSAEFGEEHPIFNNSIKMIANHSYETFSFADERVFHFESPGQYYKRSWKGDIRNAIVKPGFWSSNIRNPGIFIPRDGGSNYRNAWAEVEAAGDFLRVFVETFNEYDQGSGIYAAKTDTIYKKISGGMNNTYADTWSSTNDPYEYIKTTARGAAKFNDDEQLNAKILWHNIPDVMYKGETFIAKVIVRNTGNEQWNAANDFKFGEQDSDPVLFGSTRYLIDDSQDEIPEYGGIFRGRSITFNIEITAPDMTGTFVTNWGMLQEYVAWFGETITKSITVTEPTGIKQQSIQKEFIIYPNPVRLNSDIYIKGSFEKGDRIVLVNINGNKIFEKEILNNTKNLSLQLQKNNIVEGVYIIQIISDKNTRIKKIIVSDLK